MATGSRTALVVEDDPGIMSLLCEILEDAGFTTTCHRLGRPAVKALWQQRFDLMVVDVNLPDMNGLTLYQLAREHYGEDAVILVISATKAQNRQVTSLEVGANELLARVEAKVRRLPGPQIQRHLGPGGTDVHRN